MRAAFQRYALVVRQFANLETERFDITAEKLRFIGVDKDWIDFGNRRIVRALKWSGWMWELK